MKFKITILAFCISMLSFAQERYRVLYDYETEKVSYLQLDKNNKVKDTLERPKIKRNSLVELRLTNVNPFAVDVETDVKEEALHQGGEGFNFSSLLGGLNSFSSSSTILAPTTSGVPSASTHGSRFQPEVYASASISPRRIAASSMAS